MKEVLLSEKPASGLWGVLRHSLSDFVSAWAEVNLFAVEEFELSLEEARDLFDSDFGRIVGEDILGRSDTFTLKSIRERLLHYAADETWKEKFARAIADVRDNASSIEGTGTGL